MTSSTPRSTSSPKQRVAVVTGASSGIGQACASLLASRGFRVYGLARSAPDQRSSADLLYLPTDVTDDASVRDAVRAVLLAEGRIDALINSAGSSLAGAVEDTNDLEALRQLDVNLLGPLRLCRAVLPAMRTQRSGYIVNIGSIAGLIAVPYQGLYSASKFALEGLTEALRLELRSFGIHVVLVEPGDHRTGFTRNRVFTVASASEPTYRNAAIHAVGRMARDEQAGPPPEQIARLILRVLNASHPRLRYTCGPASQRAAIWLKRLTPYTLMEEILARYYG